MVYQWLKSTAPFKYVVMAVGAGIEALKKLNGTISFDSISEMLKGNSVADGICGVISGTYSVITEVLEVATKAAFVLFDWIDAARERLQGAIKGLTRAVFDCIMGVYNMIEMFLCDVVKLSLVMDWESLMAFMSACPCICKFIAWLFGCTEDDDGTDISTHAPRVINCIRAKYPFLDAVTVGAALSGILNEYIKKYLVFAFNLVNTCIDVLFNALIIPLRTLIKKYVRFLRKKWDLTFVIDGMRKTGLDCLLIYTEEKDDDGSTYYGMSVLDMVATLKSWVPCIEYACPSLSERIKTKVRQLNKDLRLNGEFWTKEFECDLYAICMRFDGTQDDLDEYLKGMGDRWSSLWDSLKSKRTASGLCGLPSDDQVYVGVGNPAVAVYRAREDMGIDPSSDDDAYAVSDAADFAEATDGEYLPHNGSRPLTEFESQKMQEMAENISAAAGDSDEYFVDLWYQYLRFIGRYRMRDAGFKAICRLCGDMGRLPGTFAGSSTTQFLQYSTSREPSVGEVVPRRVNYFYTSDYSAARVDRVMTAEVRQRGDDETLVDYYARMYRTVTNG